MKYPVLLPNIFDYPFTYKSNLNLKVGEYVKVSFGKSKITGVVWDNFEKNNNKNFKIKEIDKRLNIKPLKKETIKFLNWFSEYNLVPKGMSLKLHLLSGEAIENFDDKEYNFFLKRDDFKEFKLLYKSDFFGIALLILLMLRKLKPMWQIKHLNVL